MNTVIYLHIFDFILNFDFYTTVNVSYYMYDGSNHENENINVLFIWIEFRTAKSQKFLTQNFDYIKNVSLDHPESVLFEL